MEPKKIGILVVAALLITGILAISGKLFETNDAGYLQVKQAAASGTLSVKTDPGMYWQGFGEITTYQSSDMYYFSSQDGDGEGVLAEPIDVAFNDGGRAQISGSIKFRLSSKDEDVLLLHNEFKTYERVKHDLIRQVVQESLNKTAATMKAEESYSSRLAEFTTLAEEQVRIGVYETISEQIREKDADGNEQNETVVKIKVDKDGHKIVSKKSALVRYNVEVISFVIKKFEFDEKTQAIIAKKKEAEQERIVAKAKAERAKQDAITAAEQGKANVAEAEATALVAKKTAVIAAEKEKEVAVQQRLQAEEEAKAKIVQGEAEAKVAKQKVAAGLTPLERATLAKETAIGVAEQLAKVVLPKMMIIGGDSKGGHAINPFDAVGLESFQRISERLAGTTKTKGEE